MSTLEFKNNLPSSNQKKDSNFTTPKKIPQKFSSQTCFENETEKTDSFKSTSNGFSDENKSETTEIIENQDKKKSLKRRIKQIENPDLLSQTNAISKILDQFSELEKKEVLSISDDVMMLSVQKEIDCVGCFFELQNHIDNVIKTTNKGMNSRNFNLYAYSNFGIGPNSSNYDIAHLLSELKFRSDVLQDFNKDLNIKKKKESGHFHNKKTHRCLLHSKKPILNKNLYSIIENNINDFDDYIQIEEANFLKTLNNYFKKRRFCNTCQENIIFAYEQLKENADSPESLSEQEVSSEPELYRIERKKCIKDEIENKTASESLEFHCKCRCHLLENYNNCNCSCDEQISNYSDINNEDDSEKIDIMSIIKFCDTTKTIVFPAQVEIMKEFLSRSETDFSIHSRHTLTKESAQEELLICLGLTLKDKLQNHWKCRKSEEIIKLMFYNISANCIIENITYYFQKKINEKNQEVLENYLKQEELVKEKKKEKLKKKRCKNKEKKKNKKNQPGSSINKTLTDIDEDKQKEEINIKTVQKKSKKNNIILSENHNDKKIFLEEYQLTEKEKEFLYNIGWQETSPNDEGEISECELHLTEKLKQDISEKREHFRKNLNQKFQELIQKK